MNIKEELIKVTTELIKSNEADADSITVRMIAEKAGVGVGLINYHFQSKDKLIEICIQRIIESVVVKFKPKLDADLDHIDKLKVVSKLVMDFLIENPSVSRISILGDFNSPRTLDNTMKTVIGLLNIMNGMEFEEKYKKLLSFGLVSIMQAIFLRRSISSECIGFDLNMKSERDRVMDFYIESMFGGRKSENTDY